MSSQYDHDVTQDQQPKYAKVRKQTSKSLEADKFHNMVAQSNEQGQQVPVHSDKGRWGFCRAFRAMCACFGPHGNGVYEPVPQGNSYLLSPQTPENYGKKTLVLDLDETLVHSSFKPLNTVDIEIEIMIENNPYRVFVKKRPGVDAFMDSMAKHYEVVVFTASLSKYASPVLDRLDPHKNVSYRLYRESCVIHKGSFVKDLSRIGRDLKNVIIVDNSPNSYILNPANAVPITSFFDNDLDTELKTLETVLLQLKDVENVMDLLGTPEFLSSKYQTSTTVESKMPSADMLKDDPRGDFNSPRADKRSLP